MKTTVMTLTDQLAPVVDKMLGQGASVAEIMRQIESLGFELKFDALGVYVERGRETYRPPIIM